MCFLYLGSIVAGEQIDLLKNYNLREPYYPSYVDLNHYGFCLRAAKDLPAGTVVATANFEESNNPYIANHSDPEYKYVALVDVNAEGIPTWGRIRGKWAFCNHSCDPNCDIKPGWIITTNRFIQQGDELTTSYDAYIPGFAWPDNWNFSCLCQTANCKKFITGYRFDMIYPLARQ